MLRQKEKAFKQREVHVNARIKQLEGRAKELSESFDAANLRLKDQAKELKGAAQTRKALGASERRIQELQVRFSQQSAPCCGTGRRMLLDGTPACFPSLVGAVDFMTTTTLPGQECVAELEKERKRTQDMVGAVPCVPRPALPCAARVRAPALFHHAKR